MRTLEHRIPPPVVAAVIAFGMWHLATLLPAVAVAVNLRLAAATAVGLIGIAIDVVCAIAFWRARTTVNPLRPANTQTLVTDGLYRFSRNPMYVGQLLVLLAWAIYLASPLSLAGPVAFILFINRFQIEPEEKVLASRFGDAYARYRAATRRWL
jgi:protein-S-isoprenylcysteine O-methyltransferase Ste14